MSAYTTYELLTYICIDLHSTGNPGKEIEVTTAKYLYLIKVDRFAVGTKYKF